MKGETVLAARLHVIDKSLPLPTCTPKEWNDTASQIRRVVEPVFVQLRWGDKASCYVEFGADSELTC